MIRTDKIILDILARNPLSSSKEVCDDIQLDIGYATVKRILKKLSDSNYTTSILYLEFCPK